LTPEARTHFCDYVEAVVSVSDDLSLESLKGRQLEPTFRRCLLLYVIKLFVFVTDDDPK
jgi:hypothetical protein